VPLRLLLPSGEHVAVDGVMYVGSEPDNDVILSDNCVSRKHCILEVRSDGHTTIKDLGSTNGTWVNGVKITEAELLPGSRVALGATRLRAVAATSDGSPILGNATAIEELRRQIDVVAPLAATVLVVGETGAGKDLVAQALHGQSGRTGAYLPVNCAGINRYLVESVLFGHEKGSFTGADRRHVGVFEEADGGTLFLDEVGELELDLQSRLLRVLERHTVRPIGASQDVAVDVRVVAATHVDLGAAVATGRFRRDLFYRLEQQVIRVPPLRERLGDLPLLAASLLSRVDPTMRFSDEALRRLGSHNWPGNVRELSNCVDRAAMLSQSPIEPEDILFDAVGLARPKDEPIRVAVEGRKLVDIQKEVIALAIRNHRGNVNRAAETLGMPKSTLYDWVKRLGLSTE